MCAMIYFLISVVSEVSQKNCDGCNQPQNVNHSRFFFTEWRQGSFPLLHPSSPSHTRMLLGIAWDYCVHYVLPLPPKSGIPHVWGQLSSQEKGSQRSQGRSLSETCCRPIWRWRAVASGQWPVHPRYLPRPSPAAHQIRRV